MSDSPLTTPSLRRRMAAFFYEGVLLFGVVMIAEYLFSTLTQQRHALYLREASMAFLFVVLGIYFGWFWSRSGQTLAMKTWHIRLMTADGRPVSQARALARYVASWIWLLPPLAYVGVKGLDSVGGAGATVIVFGWIAGYALLSKLHPQGQFSHDVLCGTRLVTWRPVVASR